MGFVREDRIPALTKNPLQIGNDVWIRTNVIITPGCKKIGDGAIIAAGSVVTHDVPSFAIVGGVPARVLRKRFPQEIEQFVLASKWWERHIEYILDHLDCFTTDITPEVLERFKRAFLT